MLADRLSLAASSLASEKREVVCKLACLYQRIVPITCSTTTSPPGRSSIARVRFITRRVVKQGAEVNSVTWAIGSGGPAVG